jgi:glycosyltransferase involved in cell wall biosynthesis
MPQTIQQSRKILLLSDTYPPVIGGAELQTQLLARHLTKRGHTVHVITYWQRELSTHEIDNTIAGHPIHIYRIKGITAQLPGAYSNPARLIPPPFPDPGAMLMLRQLLRQIQPDVVHSYGWLTHSAAAAMVGSKVPLVVAMREYGHTCALRTMVYKGQTPCSGPQLKKCLDCAQSFFGRTKGTASVLGIRISKALLQRQIRGVHSISSYMHMITWRDLFHGKQPGQGNRVVADMIIPSFRDDSEDSVVSQKQVDSYLTQLPSEPFILFVGALRKVKGLAVLTAAYERLQAAPPLVLIGVPSHDTPNHWPQGVKVVHNFPHSAVMQAWRQALFGVAPSLWPEPFGNVIHEGMSQARVMIGTTPGGHTDMIEHGVNGYLLPPNNVDALASAMQQLLDSPDLREQMGQAAAEHAKKFSASYCVPQFEQLYEDVIARTA